MSASSTHTPTPAETFDLLCEGYDDVVKAQLFDELQDRLFVLGRSVPKTQHDTQENLAKGRLIEIEKLRAEKAEYIKASKATEAQAITAAKASEAEILKLRLEIATNDKQSNDDLAAKDTLINEGATRETNLEVEIERLRSDLLAEKDKMGELKRNVQESETRAGSLEDQLQEEKQKRNGLEADLLAARAELNTIREGMTSERSTLRQHMDEDIEELKGNLARKAVSIKKLTQTVEALSEEIAGLEKAAEGRERKRRNDTQI